MTAEQANEKIKELTIAVQSELIRTGYGEDTGMPSASALLAILAVYGSLIAKLIEQTGFEIETGAVDLSGLKT